MPDDPTSRRGRSSDVELMLAAARLHLEGDDVSRAHAAISRGIDWNAFIPRASYHGVVPLLYRHLANGPLDAELVPAAAIAELRSEASRTTRRGLLLTGHLVSLLGEFERQEIQVVPLKGPVLAQQLYGSVGLRRFIDLDVLVADEDLERATRLITDHGYRAESSPMGSVGLAAIHHAANHHLSFLSDTNTHRVELHYNLCRPIGRRRFTLSTIQTGLERLTFLGALTWGLRPEELLTYLCVHGRAHMWDRLEWVASVAELLRSGRVLDWDRVNALARGLSGERAVRAGLCLAHALCDAPVPLAQLRGDRSARGAARSVARRLGSDTTVTPSPLQNFSYQLRTDTGARARFARMWSTLVVPTVADVEAVPLPRVLWPVYYPLRPVRLLMRQLRRLGRASVQRVHLRRKENTPASL